MIADWGPPGPSHLQRARLEPVPGCPIRRTAGDQASQRGRRRHGEVELIGLEGVACQALADEDRGHGVTVDDRDQQR